MADDLATPEERAIFIRIREKLARDQLPEPPEVLALTKASTALMERGQAARNKAARKLAVGIMVEVAKEVSRISELQLARIKARKGAAKTQNAPKPG